MNIAITTSCNKGCSYCFAAQHRAQNSQIMSIETFRELLDSFEGSNIKLLGGEPTFHPQFSEFIDELIKRKKSFTLISNFLFSEKVLQKLKEAITEIPVSFLINSTDLDVGNRIQKWSYNYNELYRILYYIDREQHMSCGYTFDPSKSWKYYVEYTDFLLKHIPTIERIRYSLSFPGDSSGKNNFYFINNTQLGELFLIMTRKAIDIGAAPSIDCIIYPCMFKNKEEFKFVSKFSEKVETKCSHAPSDVFSNKEVIYCYPLKDKVKANAQDFESEEELQASLQNTYNKYIEKIQVPHECSICSYYQSECNGPCLGFYDLESIYEN